MASSSRECSKLDLGISTDAVLDEDPLERGQITRCERLIHPQLADDRLVLVRPKEGLGLRSGRGHAGAASAAP